MRLAIWFTLLAAASVLRWVALPPAKPEPPRPMAFPERLGDLPQGRLWLCLTRGCQQWKLGGPEALHNPCPICGATMHRWLLDRTGHGPLELIDERVFVHADASVAVSLSHWPAPSSLLLLPGALEHLPRLWYSESMRETDPDTGLIHLVYTSVGPFNQDVGHQYPVAEWYRSHERAFPRWRDWWQYALSARLRGEWVDAPVRVFVTPPLASTTEKSREELRAYYRRAFTLLTEPGAPDRTLRHPAASNR